MNLIPGRKTRAEVQALRGQVEALRSTAELQALVIDDITTASNLNNGAGKKYVGNEYLTYKSTIKEIADKYEGNAEWGILQTGNIIDVRAAFIIGQGVAAIPEKKEFKNSPEMDFIKAFFDYNDLDREMAQEFAKEAEIEGCFLGHLVWNEDDQQVALRFRSRVEKDYTITTAPNDYAWYQSASWRESDASTDTILKEGEFVYARFGGRIHKPNEPRPKIGKCLTQIDSIDKALRDWREINHLFAAPVPTIECPDAVTAKAMDEATKSINWKLRKMITIAGKLVFASPNLQGGSEALEKEIISLAKMISGTTGTPVHFLGLPDLMSNRSTADNLMELVTASTSKERAIWAGVYLEIVTKAMKLWNANSKKTALDPNKLKIIIPYVTEAAWKRIIDIYLPLYTADAIDLETLLSQIPNIDVDAEMEKQAKRDAAALEKFMSQGQDNPNDPNNQGQFGAGNQGNKGKQGAGQ